MVVPLIALLLGAGAGFLLGKVGWSVSGIYLDYIAIATLASLDAVVGGWRARREGVFDDAVFLSGFLMNTAVAVALVYFGDVVQLNLYLAAVVVFGLRLFTNLGVVRRDWLGRPARP